MQEPKNNVVHMNRCNSCGRVVPVGEYGMKLFSITLLPDGTKKKECVGIICNKC